MSSDELLYECPNFDIWVSIGCHSELMCCH